ncbi:hypothetical protein [Planctomycetes bacterium CA13]
MATTLLLDGDTVFKSGDLTTMRYSADIPFTVDGQEVLISIRDTTFGSKYSITAHGLVLDGIDPTLATVEDDRDRMVFQSTLFTFFVGAPLLYFFVGKDWFVGPIRADYFGIAFFAISGFSLLRRFVQKNRNESSDAPKDRASRFYNGNHNAGPP